MPQTISDLTTIEYDDLGAGDPALLLLHTWCASRRVWDGLLEVLGERHRVIALDWRSHGGSGPAAGDFGEPELLRDAVAVMEQSGARRFVPVAQGQAGWVALGLRRRLRDVIAGAVLVQWRVSRPAPGFFALLDRMRVRHEWRASLDRTLLKSAGGVDDAELRAFLDGVAGMPADMWDRAAREIEASYTLHTSPLDALAALEPPMPALHLYAQPEDPSYLEQQQSFAAEHPWFTVKRLPARSRFPAFEVPESMAAAIERFVEDLSAGHARRAA